MKKLLSFDVILRDRELTDLFVNDQIERQAAYGNMRSLVFALQLLLKRPISDCKLPEEVHLRAVLPGETRVRLPDGRFVLASDEGVTDVLPLEFSAKNVLTVAHTMDRGSVGAAMIHFCQSQQLLWTVHFGWFHDLWNSIKQAAKRARSSRVWHSVLKFMLIGNMNHGPYQSGAWGKAKQEALKNWIESHSIDSPEFQLIAPKFAAANGLPCDSREDMQRVFGLLAKLPSCTESGPVLKLARWLSIQEVWKYYRKEMWGLKLVLSPHERRGGCRRRGHGQRGSR